MRGGVIWQGPKTWKKYEVRKLKLFSKDNETWGSDEYFLRNYGYMIKDASYDSNDRKNYTIRYESLKFTRSFYYPTEQKRILANRIVILQGYGENITCMWVFDKEDLSGEEYENNYTAWTESYKYTYRDTEERGKYLCEVEAEENTYPNNGIKGDYWYVLQE